MSMKRGQIWLVDLAPTLGAEMTKARPAVIVSSDTIGTLPLKVVVPVTAWQPVFAKFPWMVRIDPDAANGLSKASAADTFQVRSLSQIRFVHQIGDLSSETLDRIEQALVLVLEISP
jgi:mRNA interferase MazF